MKLYITRHGETKRNAEQRVLGRTDDPLSEKGLAQAAELAEKMKDIEVDMIFVSPLSRARQTAQAVADVKGLIPIVDDRLIETNFGDFEGVERWCEAYQNAKRDHFKRYPNGESYFDMATASTIFCLKSGKSMLIKRYWWYLMAGFAVSSAIISTTWKMRNLCSMHFLIVD